MLFPDDPAFPTQGRAAGARPSDEEAGRPGWPQQPMASPPFNDFNRSNYDENRQVQTQEPLTVRRPGNGFDRQQEQQPYGNMGSSGDIDRLQSYRMSGAAGSNGAADPFRNPPDGRNQQYVNDNNSYGDFREPYTATNY